MFLLLNQLYVLISCQWDDNLTENDDTRVGRSFWCGNSMFIPSDYSQFTSINYHHSFSTSSVTERTSYPQSLGLSSLKIPLAVS